MTAAPAPAQTATPDEEQVVRAHLPLVSYAVTEISRRLPAHITRDDLTSAGMAALLLSVRSYDPARGVSFTRYAQLRVRGALIDELRTADWASRSVRAKAREHETAADRLAARLGRPATRSELADELGTTVDNVTAQEHDLHRSVVLSFQAVAGDDPEAFAMPSVEPGPDAVLLQRERNAYLLDAVAELPERLRAVVTAAYFDEAPMAQTAEALGVTESRVSQMRAEALGLLKDALNAQLAPERVPAAEVPGGRAAKRREGYYAAVAARSDYKARLSLPDQREAADSTRRGVLDGTG